MNTIQENYEEFRNLYKKGVRTFGPTPVLLGAAYLAVEISLRRGEIERMPPAQANMEMKRLAEKYVLEHVDLDKELETAREWIPFLRKNLKGLPSL